MLVLNQIRSILVTNLSLQQETVRIVLSDKLVLPLHGDISITLSPGPPKIRYPISQGSGQKILWIDRSLLIKIFVRLDTDEISSKAMWLNTYFDTEQKIIKSLHELTIDGLVEPIMMIAGDQPVGTSSASIDGWGVGSLYFSTQYLQSFV